MTLAGDPFCHRRNVVLFLVLLIHEFDVPFVQFVVPVLFIVKIFNHDAVVRLFRNVCSFLKHFRRVIRHRFSELFFVIQC